MLQSMERHGKVKKIELVRADKKYSTKYETMNGTVLEKLQEENNRFLRKCLGTPSKKSMTGVEYYYEWGQYNPSMMIVLVKQEL